jgi:methyl-accepting chemotaxis protein
MTYDPNRPTTTGATQREIDRTAERAHDTVDRAANTAQNAADTVSDKAQQVASTVKDKAQDIGQQAADRADDATTTVGEKMSDVAQTIRERAPSSGTLGNVADTAATTLDRAGTYLQQQDLGDMRADLEDIIRRHPIESLLVGLGVGYLLARSMRR